MFLTQYSEINIQQWAIDAHLPFDLCLLNLWNASHSITACLSWINTIINDWWQCDMGHFSNENARIHGWKIGLILTKVNDWMKIDKTITIELPMCCMRTTKKTKKKPSKRYFHFKTIHFMVVLIYLKF